MKKALRNFFQRHLRKRAALSLVGPLALLLAGSQSAQAQTTTFPRIVNFDDATKTGFRLGGKPKAATIEATSTTTGLLRLTDNNTFQAGYAIDNASFPAPSGFSISFEYFAYNGTGADGFSVFLIDADKTSAAAFTSGAPGGALGYAQRNIANDGNNSPGVPNGYIGIGIDEYGNFANTSEGKVGGQVTGTTLVKDAVSIRGSGVGTDAASTTDYPYLAGSGTLPFGLAVPRVTTRVTDPNDPNYRRAYIDVIPQTTNGVVTYKIRVRIQHGKQIQTAIDNVSVPKPPENLRIGFSGSTGGSTNFHEIDNLAVLQAPIANDDAAQTRYDRPVSFSVVANDIFSYSNYQQGTVDLNLGQAGIQNTLTVAGGTLTVAADGTVTFTPDGTFAGVLTIPYQVQDVAGFTNKDGAGNASPYFSNPANIIITVTGADLATSISGPTTANPGAKITYAVSTTNLGVETALNVVPTLQLPAGLSGVTVSSGSYDATSGLVTFGTTASLTANAAPISNSVSFTAPATGSVTGTAAFKTPPGVPDPNTTNNTASITTTISGIANVATACATPGKDGPGAPGTNDQANTYYPATASASKGATSITLGAAVGSTTPIGAGDLLLVMQMQGADINTSNTNAYGAGTTSGSGNSATNLTAGQYEYAIAKNAVPTSGGPLQLVGPLANAYQQQDFSGTTVTGQRRFQVIRVPQYSSLTLTGAVTGTAWNGSTGGVLVFDVAGKTTFNANASLDMSGKGFRGGGGKTYTGAAGYAAGDYRNNSNAGTAAAHGSKGEGTAGTPRFVNNGYASVVDNTVEGYLNGSVGAGAPGNAGGGGTDYLPTNNTGNSGGAGGGNAGTGGLGGYGRTSTANNTGLRALGGSAFGSSASLLVLGGGGGAGSANGGGIPNGGAAGGGLVILRTGTVTGTGTVNVNGAAASNNAGIDGGGGGGAGGSALLLAGTPGGLSTITVTATGGSGGNSLGDNNPRGPGGGGGGGVIYANGALAASPVTGGTNGVTNAGANTAFGATSGAPGAATTTVDATKVGGISSNTSCLPMLTAALSTSTPNVTRNSGGVNPATYTLTVSNTGGAVQAVGATVTMDNSGTNGGASGRFLYKDGSVTAKITAADGTVTTLPGSAYSLNTAIDGTPAFGGISLPAGATLSITFQATIATRAVDGVAYQSGAKLSYSDPTRTTTSSQVSPADNYPGGGKVPGSNYAAASSINEDVTIVKPLPVELTRFEVVAAGLDARLSWTTASEKNNAYFEVQRSLDGKQFETVGKRTGQGSTQARTDYAYPDAGAGRLLTGQPIYYRLRQVDYDGQEAFSPVRVVTFGPAATTAVALYPNPSAQHPTVTLDLTGLPIGAYQVQVLDLTGRLLRQQTLAGGQRHPLAVQALPMGSYLVQVHGSAVHLSLKLVRD